MEVSVWSRLNSDALRLELVKQRLHAHTSIPSSPSCASDRELGEFGELTSGCPEAAEAPSLLRELSEGGWACPASFAPAPFELTQLTELTFQPVALCIFCPVLMRNPSTMRSFFDDNQCPSRRGSMWSGTSRLVATARSACLSA